MVKNKAFTLAEVLITLAIIGVVAALTIPSVIVKQQKTQYYTQFMKAFNVLNNAFTLASVEYGTPDSWGGQALHQLNKPIIEQNIFPHLKISKICLEDEDNCGLRRAPEFKLLDGTTDEDSTYEGMLGSNNTFISVILNDGMIMNFSMWPKDFIIIVDTNGIKGPNTYGRDIFELTYTRVDGKYMLTSYPLINKDTLRSLEDAKARAMEDCSTEKATSGDSCPARLLLERKMNY